MVKYRNIGEKLAVKGLNSSMALGFNISFFLLLCLSCFLAVLTAETNTDHSIQVLFICMFIIFLAIQCFFLCGFIKIYRKFIVFNKNNGLIEFYAGEKYKKRSLGKVTHWHIQQVLHKNINGGFYDYHAVLVGSKGKLYIGLSAITQKALINKLSKLNEYFKVDFIVSTSSIDTFEALKQQKRYGGV